MTSPVASGAVFAEEAPLIAVLVMVHGRIVGKTTAITLIASLSTASKEATEATARHVARPIAASAVCAEETPLVFILIMPHGGVVREAAAMALVAALLASAEASKNGTSKAAEATARDVASATAAGTVCAEEAALIPGFVVVHGRVVDKASTFTFEAAPFVMVMVLVAVVSPLLVVMVMIVAVAGEAREASITMPRIMSRIIIVASAVDPEHGAQPSRQSRSASHASR
mmetsp:Transcript_33825/g.69742  ORF Transcript_33825/g.69742 Transcript_33825/m.69742 type:complete len:228 (-) Transcript_33825:1-684(-)